MMSSVFDFLRYLFGNYIFDLLPVFGMSIVLITAIVFAIRHTQLPLNIRLLGVLGILCLTLAVVMEVLQPIVQLYLEEELDIIFLEANKYTGVMRNLRYLLYPAGMFSLGFAIFDDRYEEGWNTKE